MRVGLNLLGVAWSDLTTAQSERITNAYCSESLAPPHHPLPNGKSPGPAKKAERQPHCTAYKRGFNSRVDKWKGRTSKMELHISG